MARCQCVRQRSTSAAYPSENWHGGWWPVVVIVEPHSAKYTWSRMKGHLLLDHPVFSGGAVSTQLWACACCEMLWASSYYSYAVREESTRWGKY
jgi:hypothetical protein